MTQFDLRWIRGAFASATLAGSLFVGGSAGAVDGVLELSHPSALAAGYPITIATSGSYVLTSNLTPPAGVGAIVVSAPNVEIDLNGFSVTGAGGAAATGIVGSSVGLVVENGTITGFSGPGVALGGEAKLLELHVSANGGGGVIGAAACLIENSVIAGNSGGPGLEAFGCKIENNVIEANGGPGILGDKNLIDRNRLSSNAGSGIEAPGGGAQISNNVIASNTGAGISCGASCTIHHNTIESNGGSGAILSGPGSSFTSNSVSFNGTAPGLSIVVLSGYSNNTMTGNVGPEVAPGAHPTDAFFNICDGAAC